MEMMKNLSHDSQPSFVLGTSQIRIVSPNRYAVTIGKTDVNFPTAVQLRVKRRIWRSLNSNIFICQLS